ncbi:hypothetical protein CC86DRAFT_382903 [Ophiobolus disseminans]|uniref:Uncharacterized protein n=1 Tax=Ophiobolus disseminans TaxID=1469910 RepID=A0A6A6ZZJ2_9PLEO|nr:hypothetical protein CC86DRAFT_382903 [Ophiobolus disseminans]
MPPSELHLNWSGFYIGTNFTLSTALQFVAKLDELFMQASILSEKQNLTLALRYWTVQKVVANELYKGSVQLATATIPTQFSAQALGRVTLGFNSNRTALVELPRPVVTAKYCSSATIVQRNSTIMHPRTDGYKVAMLFSFGDLIQTYIDQGGQQEHPLNTLLPVWYASPEPHSSSSIFIFIRDSCSSRSHPISAYLQNGTYQSFRSCPYVSTCTVNAYWQSSKHEMSEMGGLRVVQTTALTPEYHGILKDSRAIFVDWNKIAALQTTEYNDMIHEEATGGSIGLAVSLATVILEIPWEAETAGSGSRVPEGEAYTTLTITTASHGYGYGTSST